MSTHIVCSLFINSRVLDGQSVGVFVLESPVILVLVTFHFSLQHIWIVPITLSLIKEKACPPWTAQDHSHPLECLWRWLRFSGTCKTQMWQINLFIICNNTIRRNQHWQEYWSQTIFPSCSSRWACNWWWSARTCPADTPGPRAPKPPPVNILLMLVVVIMIERIGLLNVRFAVRDMEYFESLSSGAASFAVYTLYPPKYDQLALTPVGKKSSLALFPETGLYAGRLSPQLSLFDSNWGEYQPFRFSYFLSSLCKLPQINPFYSYQSKDLIRRKIKS